MGGVQLEKDGELTEAGKANGSPLIGMNRDTANTEKELWNSEQSQTVDATLDHRLLSESGLAEIKEDYKRTEIGIDAIGNLAENSVSLNGKGEGETSLRQHMMDSQDYFTATKSFVQNGSNSEHIKALSDPNATPEQKQAAYTTLVNTIATQMGIDPTEAKVLVGRDPTFAGAYSTDTKMVYINDLAHDSAGAAVNTVGHETQHYLDDKKNPTAERTAQYASNRDDYANIMGNSTEDYLTFNFAQSGNSLAGTNSHSLGTTASQINKNVNLLVDNKDSFADENANALDHRRISGNHAMALPAYLQAELEQGNDKGVSAQEVMIVLSRLAENHGRTTDLNAEIDQLDAAALGVSPETLEAVKNLPDGVKNRIVAIELKDLCEGAACKIGASIIDAMVNPESFDEFALEYAAGAAAGKLIDAGIDAYQAGKAGSKAADEVASTAKEATDNLAGVRAEGDFGKLPPNQKYYEIETTSGVVIKATEGKTTTVLGTYVGDTRNIIDDQLILAKNADYTVANNGGFNVLNVPDNMFKTPDQFWKEVNEPFLKAAVERGDDIYLATKPEGVALINPKNSDGLSGFGREVKYLESHGYKYDSSTGKMIKK